MWQPIETAPRDGTPILVTDGERLAAAVPHDFIEPDQLGYNNSPMFGGDTRRPNPDAGIVRHLWFAIGCSAFNARADVEDEDGYSMLRNPTHWMPLPAPPCGN